jgi:AraC-like DNA-binding protein
MKNVLIDPSNERKIVDFRELGFSDVLALGRYSYAHAHEPLKGHTHGDMFEICYLEEGTQVYEVEGQEYLLKGGDVFVTFPNEIHGSGSSPLGRGRLYWMLIALPAGRGRFLNLSPLESRELVGRLLDIPYRHFKGGAPFKGHLESIFKTYENDESSLKVAGLKNQMLRFLLDVLERAEHHARNVISPAIAEVQRYIEEHLLDESPQISQLAEMAELSVSRFKARFKEEVGISPGSYIITLKMEKAKEMLKDGKLSITEIAFELGFSSSQYFSTVFKRFTMLSPNEWRGRDL